MKIAAIICRTLMGLAFVFFGLNGFLNFIPAQLPSGAAGQFLGAMIGSHYVLVVSGVEVLAGALLLVGRFVPLGLVLIGPVIVNILCYHIFLDRSGLSIAVVVVLLWAVVAWRERAAFAPLFVA